MTSWKMMRARTVPPAAADTSQPARFRAPEICWKMLGWLGRMYSQKQAAEKPTCRKIMKHHHHREGASTSQTYGEHIAS
jgi:hypothetical protein